MMTLDGTFWVEDGVPYMVFCHEWVQIKDGTVEYVATGRMTCPPPTANPSGLFNGSDAVWSKKSDLYGCHVTDGPYLYRTKTGKLVMLWSEWRSSLVTRSRAGFIRNQANWPVRGNSKPSRCSPRTGVTRCYFAASMGNS